MLISRRVTPPKTDVTALTIGVGITTGVTVTVTVEEVIPPGPVAVSVYGVVTVGETVMVPESATAPTP